MTTAVLDRATTAETAAISGIASSPSVDSYGHSVRPGAFDASIARRGLSGPQGVKLLASHGGFPIGKILSLRTIGQDLRISAELNLELQSARDLHSIIKHSGGLNFSVGFKLEEFAIDEKAKAGDPWLIIKRGDLSEVSIVTFPACENATMDAKSRATSPSFAKAMTELQRARVLLGGKPVDRLAQLQAEQGAILGRIAEIRQAIRKRQRDEETLRQYRHWRDAQANNWRNI